jgi:hypothetical protein
MRKYNVTFSYCIDGIEADTDHEAIQKAGAKMESIAPLPLYDMNSEVEEVDDNETLRDDGSYYCASCNIPLEEDAEKYCGVSGKFYCLNCFNREHDEIE